jgi:aminobenzoyl-glutamate utilization protein B
MKKTQMPILLAILCMVLLLSAANLNAQEAKQKAFTLIDQNVPRLIELSDAIWGFAEIALEETRSAALLADELEKEGFTVERGVAGLPTAFTARWGEGSPVIGILGEYDALPSLSQAAGVTEKQPLVKGGAGHGCGHNLFGVACLGAAVAVKRLMEEEGIGGTIIFYGCPAEETVVGKTVMAKAGLFDELDAAVSWHPGSENQVSLNSSLALNSFKVAFHGRTAHAAADPWDGRSALDAVELMDYGVNMMREHVTPTTRIHYVILDGGRAPNVVPDYAQSWYYVRALDRKEVDEYYNRILKIAEAAAMATQTELEVELITGVHNLLVNKAVAEAIYKNLGLVGAPDFSDEEQEFAKKIQHFFGSEETGLTEEIKPFKEEEYLGGGSTDVAEVSWICPLAQVNTVCAPDGVAWHNWAVVSCSGSSIGHKGMIAAAKVLAASTLDLLTDKELLQKAKEEFRKATEGKEYKSPLDETN